MQKYFSERSRLMMGTAFLLFTILSGCEKDFDDVIDVSYEDYQVSFVGGIKDTIDLKNPPDSLLELRLGFRSGSQIDKVYFDIYASDNSLLNPSPVEMHSIGNNIFANQFILKRNYPVGNYNVKFNVTGSNGVNNLVAIGYFFFNNGQDNVAPALSNLMMADTIQAGQTILFSVEASDSNGLNDIEYVFYEAYNPNGDRVVNSQGIFQFPLFDDGKTQENGDITANDGTFTVVLTFPTNAQKGIWRFEFQARDRSGLLSDKIIHNISVQ